MDDGDWQDEANQLREKLATSEDRCEELRCDLRRLSATLVDCEASRREIVEGPCGLNSYKHRVTMYLAQMETLEARATEAEDKCCATVTKYDQAADKIVALATENTRLRAALEGVAVCIREMELSKAVAQITAAMEASGEEQT